MHIKLRDHVSTQEAEKLRQDLRRDVTELREVLEKNVFFGLSKPRQVAEYTHRLNSFCRSMLTDIDASNGCW